MKKQLTLSPTKSKLVLFSPASTNLKTDSLPCITSNRRLFKLLNTHLTLIHSKNSNFKIMFIFTCANLIQVLKYFKHEYHAHFLIVSYVIQWVSVVVIFKDLLFAFCFHVRSVHYKTHLERLKEGLGTN